MLTSLISIWQLLRSEITNSAITLKTQAAGIALKTTKKACDRSEAALRKGWQGPEVTMTVHSPSQRIGEFLQKNNLSCCNDIPKTTITFALLVYYGPCLMSLSTSCSINQINQPNLPNQTKTNRSKQNRTVVCLSCNFSQ